MRGVILYGPPAAGKDTVTRALHSIDRRYQIFQRLKVGSGRTESYRMSDRQHLDALRRAGDVIWENYRYGSYYVIDREPLMFALRDHYPVVHLGQLEAVDALISATDAKWLSVYLWCPRDIAERRVIERHTGDAEARLTAWDETKPLLSADLSIDTAQESPGDAARLIDYALQAQRS